MKNLLKYISVLLVLVAFWGCQEEEPELGNPINVSELNFEIYQDANDPNKIILESRTPNVIPFWSTPSGRSTSVTDTVRLAFPGTYKFVYSVQSRGGLVSADTTTINITTTNLSYVDHPLYNLLTGGGPGNSKTWLLDLDEEGVSRYFGGPMYFFGSEITYGEECLVEDGDCWDFKPEWQGNQWVAPVGDYGSMTFGLENGATLEANHTMIPSRGQESGVFEIDLNNYTLSTSDATPLHTPNYEDCVGEWGDARIISLTEDYMQLGFLRLDACDGVALLVYNYISQEYAENWVPVEEGEPEPDLPDNWEDDVSEQVNRELTWVLSPETPFNWAALDGTLLNNWNSPADYPEWAGYTADLAANFEQFSFTFNSNDYTLTYSDPSGNESEGSYDLSENGTYTFEGINPTFAITPNINFSPTADNQLRILNIEYDNEGKVSGMWVGARDPEKPEYQAYHLLLQDDAPADPLTAWKNALVGKTFTPDINWFVNWVGAPPAFAGGWTTPETFGDDYTSNDWVYDESVRNIAETASLEFFMDGEQMKVTVSQTLVTEYQEGDDWITEDTNPEYSVTGNVNIDTETGILSIDVPLIDYAGTPARWLEENGTDGSGDWFFVPHGGSTLSTINSEGLWLGYSAPGNPDETVIFHYIVAN